MLGILLLLHGESVGSIRTSARAEESGEKADKPIDDDFKNGGAGQVFNSSTNV